MGYFCSNPHPFYHQMLASENEGGRKYKKNTTFPYFVCVHTPTCVLYLHETASSFQMLTLVNLTKIYIFLLQ